MTELVSLAGIAAALALGAASPGPSFLLVARTAVAGGREAGIATALGIGSGSLVFAAVARLGLGAALTAVPWLYVALKLVGGLYLLHLGLRIWRGATTPLAGQVDAARMTRTSRRRQYARGFVTQVSNPKTAVIYASVFAAFFPAAPSWTFDLAVLACVAGVEAGWYAIVATTLSTTASRGTYLRYKAWLDRGAGAFMACLGIRLAASSVR